MRKPWSYIANGHSVISREQGVEGLLRAAAQRSYPTPEDAKHPMMAPPDYEIRQSGRLPELQNRDLWLRPIDMSWHFPNLVTIRQEPFKRYRSRTAEKWKAKKDKLEEVKKKSTEKSDDEWSEAERQLSSCSWQQPTTCAWSSSSSWQQMSSEQTSDLIG